MKSKSIPVYFNWIPFHTNIKNNKQVDIMVKKAKEWK